MSQTFTATFINLIVMLLPLIGVNIAGADLNTALQVFTAIGTGVWILVRRYQAGGVTPLGFRK